MLLTKAFKFDVKAKEDAAGSFTGRASVYGVVDAYNDVVMPGAFARHLSENGNRIKVLNQHDPRDPIGYAELSDSDTALLANGKLLLDLQSAKDMYVRLQNDLIDGISIGYEVAKEAYNSGVRQLHEIKLWEISLVTFPANQFARVTDVKQASQPDLDDIFIELKAFDAAVKAGRVLSAANLSRLQQIMQLAQAIYESTQSSEDESGKSLETLLNTLKDLRGTAARA